MTTPTTAMSAFADNHWAEIKMLDAVNGELAGSKRPVSNDHAQKEANQ
jgi:hypothetical protein